MSDCYWENNYRTMVTENDTLTARIEALEKALRQIATLEDLPSSLSVARSIARGAAITPEQEK